MKLKQFYKYVFVFFVSLFVLTGCGNGSSENGSSGSVSSQNVEEVNENTNPSTIDSNLTTENSPTKTKGYLLDSALQGVSYVCDGKEALTNAEGMFECVEAPVTFKVGGLTLGTITAFTADGKVYPQDLLGLPRTNFTDSRLKLLARLLQSLDDDGNIDTKITITQSVRDGITAVQDFEALSESQITSLLSGIGKSLVEECGALNHLGDTSLSCNNDGSYNVTSTTTTTPTATSSNQKTTITGYAEDDPMANAKIKVTNSANNLIVEATADANGKYSLEAKFEEGKTYTLESKGKIQDKNVTLHSIFKFSSDTVINANPLTELKYQLVQSGKIIEEAEALIRDYFSVVSGEKLEQNRFDVDGSLATSMADLAKLYDGKLPIDAIEKIKEDILRNESLDVKDYSYRTLLQNKIALESSSNSLKLGEEVTVKVVGLTDVNKNYKLKWSGIPNDVADNNSSVTFTISDNPQDVYVRASLYKVDGNRSKFITSADTTINFYKESTEHNLTVENASVDNNFTVGESSMTIPAGTVTDGKVIRVREIQTGSESSIAQFEVDAGGATSGDIVFNYKYNPYLVAEPRNLQISLRSGDDVKVLKVLDIDYANHLVRFGVPLSGGISRFLDSRDKIIIEYLVSSPDSDDLDTLYDNYGAYIFEVAKKYSPNNYSHLYGLSVRPGSISLNDKIREAKILKVLMQKEDGEYKFNILTASINNIISWEAGEKIFETQEDYSWKESFEGYLLCETNGMAPCGLLFNRYKDKIVNTNKVLAQWIGYIKLDKHQASLIKYGKVITKLGVAVAQGDFNGLVTELGGVTLSEMNVDPIIVSAYNTEVIAYDLLINKTSSLDVLKGLGTGIIIDTAFSLWADSMKKDNAMKTAPIIFPLSIYYEDGFNVLTRPYDGPNKDFLLSSKKNDLIEILYPEGDKPYGDNVLYHPNPSLRDPGLYKAKKDFSKTTKEYLSNIYGFGINDPDDRFVELFFKHNIPMKEKKLAYEMFKYSFGDSESRNIFTAIKDASEFKIYTLLLEAYAIKDSEVQVTEYVRNISLFDRYFGNGHIKTRIKNDYELKISNIQNKLNNKGFIRNSSSNTVTDISNISSFDFLMETAKLKLTNEQLQALNIKKIKMETYGVRLEYSGDDNAWILDKSVKEDANYTVTENINDKFTYNSELEKNVLSFATLFDGEDFTPFDEKLVGFKITLVYEKSGIEKVLSKNFIFTTLSDTEHLVQTDFTGATLKSSAKNASTGEPIANAQVTLVPGGLTDFTDAEGNYEVSGVAAGNYTIIISKEGYRQVEAQLTLVEDETKVFEASLAIDDEHATTLGGANITLKDALNGNVVTTGYVKVREGQNNKTGDVVQEVTNDGNSSINISLYPNTYTVEVGANGYTHSFNTVTILGDMNGTYEFSITPVLSADQVRAVLSWGATPNDLDSHLVRKTNGSQDYHIYYSNRNGADANLDTDVTSSYGPETITINNVNHASVYTYYVYNFSGGAGSVLPNSGAKLEVYFGDQSRTFYVPNEEGRYWKVFEIVNGEIIPCTTGCVKNDTSTLIRKIDRESALFRNLPNK